MSVEVTRLPTGLTVVTDDMPHLQTASLGVWVGSGSRDEQPDEHGISHLLEHMAFKGTKRRTARQIAEEIEAVGGDINAATSIETTAYYARVLKADVPLALDVLSDILCQSDVRCRRADARAERHRAGDRRDRGCARRPGVRLSCRRRRSRSSRWAARSSARRESVLLVQGPQPARLSRPQLPRRPTWWCAAAGAVEHRAVVAEVERRFGHFNGPAAPVPLAARFGGGARLEARELEQVHIALALEGLPQRDPDALQPAGLRQRPRRRHVLAAVPGGAREARPVLRDLRLPRALFRHRHVRHLCRHRRGRRRRTDARRGGRDRRGGRQTSTRPRSPAPRRR